ncbi:MAG TPA: cellulase family glycosylhydrolase [Streptosporangiaceae bacterium]|nr:cellulase family glycosylhydrolase [Streptosporangiaceae bacterium]
MKFPTTMASIFRRGSGVHAATDGRRPAAGWKLPAARWLRTPAQRGVAGAVVLAAGIATGVTVFSSGGAAQLPAQYVAPGGHAATGLTSATNPGAAPQLHVSGNELVSASGQQVLLHGADRSGTEYKCVQTGGIFDGPTSTASINVMKAHGINAVRVPLNEACWNGDSYVNPAYSGANYRTAVEGYVHRLNADGMVVILDLHWTNGAYTGPASACSSAEATCQKPMPDKAEAIPFWTSVAGTFKDNDAVIFDLFNEPYPEQADQMNYAEGWQCWLNGGTCAGISYPVAGMQDMVDAVRATGANNILMLGGLEWSNDLDGWLSHMPTDPDNNLAASWHSYNFNACSTASCWNSQIAPVAAKVPLIAGEIGENDCADGYVTPLMKWLTSKGANFLAWTWNTDFNCATGPGLITNYNGQPTGFGAGVESALHDMANTHPPAGGGTLAGSAAKAH